MHAVVATDRGEGEVAASGEAEGELVCVSLACPQQTDARMRGAFDGRPCAVGSGSIGAPTAACNAVPRFPNKEEAPVAKICDTVRFITVRRRKPSLRLGPKDTPLGAITILQGY